MRVKLVLDGLQFAPDIAPPSGTAFDPASGVWSAGDFGMNTRIGGLRTRFSDAIDVPVLLTAEAMSLEERCLTAQITHVVPAHEFEPQKRLNDVVKVCLGEDPKVVLTEGKIDLWWIHDCVGVTVVPCGDHGGIKLLVRADSTDIALPIIQRRDGAGRSSTGDIGRFRLWDQRATYLEAESVIVQVPDLPGRSYDKHGDSVTDGSTVSWQTREVIDLVDMLGNLAGTKANWAEYGPFVVTASGWKDAMIPGKVKVRFESSTPSKRNEFYDPNPSSTQPSFSNASYLLPIDMFFEFETLGTYEFNYRLSATHTDGNTYSDDEDFVFHVGPISELGVRDGGVGSPLVATDRTAYTIFAANNGPDAAPAVVVTLAGVPQGSEVIAIEGQYDEGECGADGLCAGTWTLGEMPHSDSRIPEGKSPYPTLTVIPPAGTDAPASITATIANTRPYSVVIDGTTHKTDYFDYVSGNNSASIAARTGTGAALPSMPETEGVAAIRVAWDPIPEVNGRMVTRYEVQRRANPWETVAEVVDPFYFDLDVEPGETHEYRVRAVNDRGQSSPWSSIVKGMPRPITDLEVRDGGINAELPPGQRAFTIVAMNNGPGDAPAAQVTVSGLTDGDVVSHSATAGSFDPGTGIWSIGELRESGYYQDRYQRDGEVLTIVASADASAEITAEIENITEYHDYVSANDSATINATIAALPPPPETEAVTAIRVAWDPIAEVNGRQVTGYEVQRRTNPWETVAVVQDPFYFDLDVEPGETYEYRVRAVNDRNQSNPWSGSVEGTVPQVAAAPITEPIRILRIEPSIGEISMKGGSVVRLVVEVYGRQDLRDDALADRSDVTFDWTLEEFGAQPGGTVGRLVGPGSSSNDRSRTSTLDDRRVLYIAPDSPGRFRITVSLDPGTECLPKQSFETEEEAQERCTAIFEVTALRSSQIETATLNPQNPEGDIPQVLADSDGLQYEVFTPVRGGAFVQESASLIAGAGAVPDYDMIGLRISDAGPASNEGVTYGRYTLGGDWYAITAVDASGQRVEDSYELNSALEVCIPLPAELSSNISELAMVAMNMSPDDSLTILSSRVRISTSGTKVCGHLSIVPASVAVGTAGAPRPLPTALPETPAQTVFPDAGGSAPPSQTVVLWMALIGLTVLVAVFGLMLVRRRKADHQTQPPRTVACEREP